MGAASALAASWTVYGCGGDAPAPAVEPDRGPDAPAPTSGGVVLEREGDVRWQHAGTAAWGPVEVRQPLAEGDAVQTMAVANARIMFWPDRSTLDLEPSTLLRVSPTRDRTTRLSHLSGRIVARVEGEDSHHRMEVQLPPGTLVLTGNPDNRAVEARIDVNPAQTHVAMLSGRARLERRRGEAIDIGDARYVALQDDGEVLEEGAVGEQVVLRSPRDDQEVRTRGDVRFSWQPTADARSYVLEVVRHHAETPFRVVASNETSTALRLPSGSYLWSVRGQNGDRLFPRSHQRSLRVRFDRTPPSLVVLSPAAGALIDSATLVVRGRSERGASVTVDGQAATVDEQGRFTYRRALARGLTNLVVRAEDDLGNQRIVSRQVLRR